MQVLQRAAAAPGQAGSGDAAAAVRLAAAVATSVVQSYSGSPKPLRSTVCDALVGPLLPSAVALLQAGGSAALQGGRTAGALLRLVTCCLEVLPTELGGEAVEQLLGALVQAFGASGALQWGAADACLERLRSAATVLLPNGWQRLQEASLLNCSACCGRAHAPPRSHLPQAPTPLLKLIWLWSACWA